MKFCPGISLTFENSGCMSKHRWCWYYYFVRCWKLCTQGKSGVTVLPKGQKCSRKYLHVAYLILWRKSPIATIRSPRSLEKHIDDGVAFNFKIRLNRQLSSQIRTLPSRLALANNLILGQLVTLITSSLWSSSVEWSNRSR